MLVLAVCSAAPLGPASQDSKTLAPLNAALSSGRGGEPSDSGPEQVSADWVLEDHFVSLKKAGEAGAGCWADKAWEKKNYHLPTLANAAQSPEWHSYLTKVYGAGLTYPFDLNRLSFFWRGAPAPLAVPTENTYGSLAGCQIKRPSRNSTAALLHEVVRLPASCHETGTRLNLRNPDETPWDSPQWCSDISSDTNDCADYYVLKTNGERRLCVDDGGDKCASSDPITGSLSCPSLPALPRRPSLVEHHNERVYIEVMRHATDWPEDVLSGIWYLAAPGSGIWLDLGRAGVWDGLPWPRQDLLAAETGRNLGFDTIYGRGLKHEHLEVIDARLLHPDANITDCRLCREQHPKSAAAEKMRANPEKAKKRAQTRAERAANRAANRAAFSGQCAERCPLHIGPCGAGAPSLSVGWPGVHLSPCQCSDTAGGHLNCNRSIDVPLRTPGTQAREQPPPSQDEPLRSDAATGRAAASSCDQADKKPATKSPLVVLHSHKAGHVFAHKLAKVMASVFNLTEQGGLPCQTSFVADPCRASRDVHAYGISACNWMRGHSEVVNGSSLRMALHEARAVSFVRESSDRLVSATLYHGQWPTPEGRERRHEDPCLRSTEEELVRDSAGLIHDADRRVSEIFRTCRQVAARAYSLAAAAENQTATASESVNAIPYAKALSALLIEDPKAAVLMEFARSQTSVMKAALQTQAVRASGACIREISMEMFNDGFDEAMLGLLRFFELPTEGPLVTQLLQQRESLSDDDGHGTSSRMTSSMREELRRALLDEAESPLAPFLHAANNLLDVQREHSWEHWLAPNATSCPYSPAPKRWSRFGSPGPSPNPRPRPSPSPSPSPKTQSRDVTR